MANHSYCNKVLMQYVLAAQQCNIDFKIKNDISSDLNA